VIRMAAALAALEVDGTYRLARFTATCYSAVRAASLWRWLSLSSAPAVTERALIAVTVRENEPFEKALRRFRRKVEREGIRKDIKKNSFYLKPGEKRRLKQRLAEKRRRKAARRASRR
jgi:small subunit ribosomal protein S21